MMRRANTTHKKIPISIITGFLGSGKTTFLNDLIKKLPAQNFSVIVNELGQNSLDHLLIDISRDQIVDLPNGCICCSSTNALVETLHNLLKQKTLQQDKIDHIIIETSGVTDTSNMVGNLWSDQSIRENFVLAPIICMISATQWTINPEPEAVAQLSICDRILITKSDLILPTMRNKILAEIESQIEYYNPHAPKFYLPLNADETQQILTSSITEKAYTGTIGSTPNLAPGHLNNRYESFTLKNKHCIEQIRIDQFLDILLSEYGNKILRVKGIFLSQKYPEKPLVVQAVKSVLSPYSYFDKWETEPASFLTIIHQGADQRAIEELFGAIFGQINTDRADTQAIVENPLKITGL